jgi:hypothetical protein
LSGGTLVEGDGATVFWLEYVNNYGAECLLTIVVVDEYLAIASLII